MGEVHNVLAGKTDPEHGLGRPPLLDPLEVARLEQGGRHAREGLILSAGDVAGLAEAAYEAKHPGEHHAFVGKKLLRTARKYLRVRRQGT